MVYIAGFSERKWVLPTANQQPALGTDGREDGSWPQGSVASGLRGQLAPLPLPAAAPGEGLHWVYTGVSPSCPEDECVAPGRSYHGWVN